MAQVEDKTASKQPTTTTQTQLPETQAPAKVVAPVITEATQTATQDRLNKLDPEDRKTVTLISDLIKEYAGKVHRAAALGDEAQGHYGKLHGAFRELMGLRGIAHIEGARVFMAAFKTHKESLDYDLRCRHLNLLPREMRVAFTGYMDLLNRFAKSEDKGNFRKSNDVDRVLAKVSDPELAEAINAVFPGN